MRVYIACLLPHGSLLAQTDAHVRMKENGEVSTPESLTLAKSSCGLRKSSKQGWEIGSFPKLTYTSLRRRSPTSELVVRKLPAVTRIVFDLLWTAVLFLTVLFVASCLYLSGSRPAAKPGALPMFCFYIRNMFCLQIFAGSFKLSQSLHISSSRCRSRLVFKSTGSIHHMQVTYSVFKNYDVL